MRFRAAGMAVMLAAGAVAIDGCGGDSGVAAVTAPRPAPQSAQVRRSLADPQSPAAIVTRFWQSVGDGSLPLALALYQQRSIAAVGLATFAGMLADQRPTVQDVSLNILGVQPVSGGQLVRAETIPKLGTKTRHAFFLTRSRGQRPARWRIAYDTLTATSLPTFVQTQTQRSVDPQAPPGRKALSAADAAARAYRAVALAATARGNGARVGTTSSQTP